MERIELANIRREYTKELLSAIRTYNRVLEMSYTAANERIIAMLEEELVHIAVHPEFTGHPKGVEGIAEAWMEEVNADKANRAAAGPDWDGIFDDIEDEDEEVKRGVFQLAS